ncbi:MAG TPA: thiamine-phosphate kinase [Bacillota bacterium]
MDEFSFIQSIRQQTYNQSSLLKGGGDDAAVFRHPTEDVVTAVDTFVEHIHFSRETMEPMHIGYRALAANVSDLAAMGATPTYYLVAIVIPKTWAEEELKDIFLGMKTLADMYHMDLIGGDTVGGNELTVSVTVFGSVEKGKARFRHAAEDGDVVFVTGTLGDSQAGLYALTHPNYNMKGKQYFIHRHRQPSPRIEFSSQLRTISRLALNDISDGIANEAREIAEASKVTIYLNDQHVPVHPLLNQFSLENQRKWKYFGGEDFELVGTVSKKDWAIVEKVAAQTNTKVTKIGYVTSNEQLNGQVFLYDKSGKQKRLKKEGYIHLK